MRSAFNQLFNKAAQWKRTWLACAVVIVALACMRLPQAPITEIIDPSWSDVLIHANEKGLSFGHDIVFTYGPLGFLSVEYFSPAVPMERIFWEIGFKLLMALGLCLLAWRMPFVWRLVALAAFVFLSLPLQISVDEVIFAGLFAWGLLCFMEKGALLWLCAMGLAAAVAAAGLIKFTYLTTGALTISFAGCDLFLRKNRRQALAMVTVAAFGFLAGWMLLGQNIWGLVSFLSTSLTLSNGYNATMAGLTKFGLLLFLTPVTALIVVTIRACTAPMPGLRRVLLLTWLYAILFMVWKCSAVRQDGLHTSLALGFAPFAALGMEALPQAGRWVKVFSRAASVFCVAVLFVLGNDPDPWAEKLACKNISDSIAILAKPGRYIQEKTAGFQKEKSQQQLPRLRAIAGKATVDVFGFNQAVALNNELNYHPSPVFQSYIAYNRPLMELNEQFYLSTNAPEYVLFALQAIDSRFPPLENALVLRDLLANYELAGSEGNYLLLRRKGNEEPKLTLVKEGTVFAGEKIDLPAGGETNLWVEMDRKPTLLGRIQQFLYRPAQMAIVVSQAGDAQPTIFNAPAAMLSAGFLMNPLVLNNQDVSDLYASGKRRTAASFVVDDAHDGIEAWKPQVKYRIYRVDGQLGGKIHPK